MIGSIFILVFLFVAKISAKTSTRTLLSLFFLFLINFSFISWDLILCKKLSCKIEHSRSYFNERTETSGVANIGKFKWIRTYCLEFEKCIIEKSDRINLRFLFICCNCFTCKMCFTCQLCLLGIYFVAKNTDSLLSMINKKILLHFEFSSY